MSAALLVADSGPLIALARLDLLHLPARLFGSAWVTSTVWDEVTRQPRPADGHCLAAALAAGHLEVHNAFAPADVPSMAHGLDAGERSAIALALAQRAALLIDERRGRMVAEQLHLPVLGTLGLLVRGKDAGVLPLVRPLADALVASGYFLSPRLVEQLLVRIGE